MEEFLHKMEQLSSDYRATVSADLAVLRAQAAQLRGNESDRALLQQMAAMLHRIAGGAGVFGLAKLSEQSRGFELDLNDWLAAPLDSAWTEALPELRLGLERLAA